MHRCPGTKWNLGATAERSSSFASRKDCNHMRRCLRISCLSSSAEGTAKNMCWLCHLHPISAVTRPLTGIFADRHSKSAEINTFIFGKEVEPSGT